MRVLVVTSLPVPHLGGSSTYIELLVSALKDKGALAGFISSNRIRFSFRDRVTRRLLMNVAPDFTKRYLRKALMRRLAQQVRMICGRGEDVVIHAQDVLATCAALQGRPPGIPVIQTIHGFWTIEVNSEAGGMGPKEVAYIGWLEKTAMGGCDLLIPVESNRAGLARELYAVPENRIRIMENAVDLGELRRAADRRPSTTLPPRFLLVPRRLVRKNGVDVALRAFALLGDVDASLVIAGDGPLREELETLASDLGVGGKVVFTGALPREELLAVQARSAGALVPSIPIEGEIEGSSLSVLEALGAGVPLIGSAIGGIADAIHDDRFGFLVPPGDVERLAEAMRRVLSFTADERAALGKRAVQRVEQQYSLDTWADRLLDVFSEVKPRAAQPAAIDGERH